MAFTIGKKNFYMFNGKDLEPIRHSDWVVDFKLPENLIIRWDETTVSNLDVSIRDDGEAALNAWAKDWINRLKKQREGKTEPESILDLVEFDEESSTYDHSEYKFKKSPEEMTPKELEIYNSFMNFVTENQEK